MIAVTMTRKTMKRQCRMISMKMSIMKMIKTMTMIMMANVFVWNERHASASNCATTMPICPKSFSLRNQAKTLLKNRMLRLDHLLFRRRCARSFRRSSRVDEPTSPLKTTPSNTAPPQKHQKSDFFHLTSLLLLCFFSRQNAILFVVSSTSSKLIDCTTYDRLSVGNC
jgi:hypothetical protein